MNHDLQRGEITVVRAIIQDDLADHFLLLQRSLRAKRNAGLWEPPGGQVDKNESHKDALDREAAEETGLVVKKIGELVLIEKRKMFDAGYNGELYIAYGALVEVQKIGPVMLDKNPSNEPEHADFIWHRRGQPFDVEVTEQTRRFTANYNRFEPLF